MYGQVSSAPSMFSVPPPPPISQPASTPLFPIQAPPSLGPQPVGPDFRPLSSPASAPIAPPPPIGAHFANISTPGMTLIYDDDNLSMEERRAELPKHKFDDARAKEYFSRLA